MPESYQAIHGENYQASGKSLQWPPAQIIGVQLQHAGHKHFLFDKQVMSLAS